LWDGTMSLSSKSYLEQAYPSPRQPPTDGNEIAVCNIGVNFRMNRCRIAASLGAQTVGVSE